LEQSARRSASTRGRRLKLLHLRALKRAATRTPTKSKALPIANSVGSRLVALASTFPVVTPLTFENPARFLTKTEQAKQQELEASLADKEVRFCITAQYAESLTLFIPALINQMLSKRVKTENISLTKAKHMIHSTY
jgi:hypothetical protein